MKDDEKGWIKKRLQKAFLTAVRACLNENKAAQRAAGVRAKYPGMPEDVLAKILIDRAGRKTMIEGAASGGAITAAEAVIAVPAPEAGQRVLAISGIAALLAGDVAYTTKVQMQLLLEIGEVYQCPFSKDDEDDVWLIFKAALGVKGTERVGAYSRFVFTEVAQKQFRGFLRDQGRRRAAQEALRRIAGKEIAKYLSEKVLLRLIAVANAIIGAVFNRWMTRRVGKWAKVRAKIRASTFNGIEEIRGCDRRAAVLVLPVIFLTGTAHGEVTDNFVTVYAQASNRLALSATEVAEIETMSEADDLEKVLHKSFGHLDSPQARSALLKIAITAAAASALEFNNKQHACLSRLSDALGLEYSRKDLVRKVDYLRK